MSIDDPFGWGKDRDRLNELVQKSRSGQFQVDLRNLPQSPSGNAPDYITRVHQQMQMGLGSVPGVSISDIQQMPRQMRTGTGMETVNEWGFTVTKQYGKESVSTGFYGVTDYGEHFYSPNFNRAGAGTIPSLIQAGKETPLSPAENFIQAMKIGRVEDPTTGQTRSDTWSVLAGHAGIDWRVWNMPPMEQMRRGNLYGFSGFESERDILEEAESRNLFYQGGQHASLSNIGLHPSRMSGGIEEFLSGSAKRQKTYRGGMLGYRAGETPDIYSNVVESLINAPGTPALRGNVISAHLSMNPLLSPEGFATMSGSPMVEMGYGKTVRLSEEQADILRSGEIFADPQARFPGGMGQRAGSMGALRDILGQDTPSGAAFMPRNIQRIEDDLYSVEGSVYAPGASFKQQGAKYFTGEAMPGMNQFVVRGQGRQEFDIAGVLPGEKDLPLFARMAFQANYQSPGDLRNAWKRQSYAVYQRALEGDEEAVGIFERMAQTQNLPAPLWESIAGQRPPVRGVEAINMLSSLLQRDESGKYTWAQGAGELYSAVTMADLSERIQVTRATQPRGVSRHHFEMFLQTGLQQAGAETAGMGIGAMLGEWEQRGLSQREFMGQQFSLFDPRNVRPVGGGSLEDAQGFLISGIESPAYVGNLMGMFRPEYEGPRTTLAGDYLEQLALYNPKLLDYVLEQDAAGKYYNPARRVTMAHLSNESEEYLSQQRIEEFDAAKWSNIRAKYAAANMSADVGLQATMREYAQTVGDEPTAMRVRMGENEFLFPNINDLMRTAITNDRDELIRSPAASMGRMMDVLSSADPEMSQAQLEAIQSTYLEMEQYVNLPGVMREALGVTVPNLGGHIRAAPGLPTNMAGMRIQDIMQQTGFSREEVIRRTGFGGGVSEEERLNLAMLFDPAADPRMHTLSAQLVPIDYGDMSYLPRDLQEVFSSSTRLGKNQILSSELMLEAAGRDVDADTKRALITIGQQGLSLSPEEYFKYSMEAHGSETLKQQQKMGSFLSGLSGGMPLTAQAGWQTEQGLVGESISDERSRQNIGQLYNLGNRILSSFGLGLAGMVGLGEPGMEQLRSGIGRLSKGLNQGAMDLRSVFQAGEGRPESGILNYLSFMRSINISPGSRGFGYYETAEGEEKYLPGGAQMPTNLSFLMSNIIGRMGESFSEEDYAGFAPALAAGMMSISSFNRPDAGQRQQQIAEMLMQYRAGGYAEGGLDVNRLVELSGASRIEELAFGSSADPGAASVLLGALGAASGEHAQKWREGYTEEYRASQTLMGQLRRGTALRDVASATKRGGMGIRQALASLGEHGITMGMRPPAGDAGGPVIESPGGAGGAGAPPGGGSPPLDLPPEFPSGGGDDELRGMFLQLMGVLGGDGEEKKKYDPPPLSDPEAYELLQLGAQYAPIQARYLEKGVKALEGLDPKKTFRDLTRYQKLSWQLHQTAPIPSSLAGQLYGNFPTEEEKMYRRQVYGDYFGDNPEAGALFLGMKTQTGQPVKEEFENFLGTGEGLIREEVAKDKVIHPVDILQYATGEREIGSLPSTRTRRGQSLIRNITGGDEFSGVETTTRALTEHFQRLAEAMEGLQPITEGYITQTKEQAQVLKEGTFAIQILTSYAGELVTEYEKTRAAKPGVSHEAVIAEMGGRGIDLMSLVGTEGEPGLLRREQGMIERFEDLDTMRREGRLQTESQRRSMRAMGAYYGMQAMQRVIGQTMGVMGQEAIAVAPTEQALAGAVGMGPSPMGVMAAQQQNAMIARGYAGYDTFGWAQQMGNELYQLPGVANVAQMGRGIYGAWMGSRLWAENMKQLMPEGWDKTRMGQISAALPGLISAAGWTAMGAEAGLQGLNTLGVTQGASVGDFFRTTLGDIGGTLQGVGLSGGAIDILARQGGGQAQTISQQMLYGYTAEARRGGYSAADAAGLTGQISSQLGLRYATTIGGLDRGQLIAQQATALGVAPGQYGGALLGAAQQWAPLDTTAQAEMLDSLTGLRVPLSQDEALVQARQELLSGVERGKGEARQYIAGKVSLGGPLGAALAAPVAYLGAEIYGQQAAEGITDEAVEARARQIAGRDRGIAPSELENIQKFMQSQSGMIGGLQQAYGGTSQELYQRILQMAQPTANYDFTQSGLMAFQRGATLEMQMWQQTGMLSGAGLPGLAQWAGGLQPYQFTGAQQYMGMIAPYVTSPADMQAQLQGVFRPGASAQETTNLVQLAQLQERMGYRPGVGGMGQTMRDWEPWRVSSLADFQQQAAYWGGMDVGEWGTVTEEQRRRRRVPITGEAFAALDRQLGLSERGLGAYTYEDVVTQFERPGLMQGTADLLSGMSQAQLGGMGTMFEMLMANVGAPPDSRFTGAARQKYEQRWMAQQMQDIMAQLTEAYGGLYGRQISSLTGLGQVYQGLGLFGEDFNQQFGQASQFVRQHGWLAGESAAGFTEFGWGMGLNQQQAIRYGMQYGQQFQQPYMAQQFQGMAQGLVGLGGELLPSSQFLAPMVQGSTSLERQRLSGFIGGSALEYSRMLTGQDALSQQLRGQLGGLGIDLSGLTPMINPQTGQSMWYEQQKQNQYQQMMLPYMDQRGQVMQGPGGTPMTWQFMRQQEDYQMNRAFTFGGSFNLMGQQYNIPMGQLAIQQAQFGLQGEQQEYSFALQERQLGIQRERFYEGIGVTAKQQRKQYEWQIQDWEYQENRAELSFAWRMEDYDEKLRFSRGRERRLTMRQRDRDVISYTMERGHASDVRGRLEEQRQWQEEALERQKKYYEQDESLARERLQRQREFYQRGRELQQQQMEMQRLQAQLNDQLARRELEHSQMMMQKTYELQQSEWQIKLAQDQANAAMHLFYTQTLPLALSTSKQTTLTVFGEVFTSLQTQVVNAINNIITAISSTQQTTGGSGTGQGSTNTPGVNMSPRSTNYSVGGPVSPVMSREAAQFNSMIAMGAAGYADGGATGTGPFNRPAGIVHEGEFVVPQQGSLVVHADNQVQVLREILGVLQRIEKKGGPGFVLNMKSRETRQAVNAAIDLYDKSYGD